MDTKRGGSARKRVGELMTTDQVRATVTTDERSRHATTLVDQAHEEAKQIVARARFDAFRMVTDARQEAEAIIAEAAQQVDALQSPTLETAPEVDETLHEANATLVELNATLQEANEALTIENEALEQRVLKTRTLLADLETRLAHIAYAPDPIPRPTPPIEVDAVDVMTPAVEPVTEESPVDTIPAEPAVTQDVVTAPETSDPVVEEPADEVPAVVLDLDYSPSVPPPSRSTEPTTENEEPESFYTRRSANLPHIGDSAAEDSFSVIRSMRAGFE